MSTYRELTYMVLDQLKLASDDSYYTEDHVKFLLSAYRVFLLEQIYGKQLKEVDKSNIQTICLDLVESPSILDSCDNNTYLRSTAKVPATFSFSAPLVYPVDSVFHSITIMFTNMERMKFVGHNKWLQNFIYCALGPDNYLYLKSTNPQTRYLQRIKMSGVFQDSTKADELSCTSTTTEENCDPLDNIFPIEDTLITPLIDGVVKILLSPSYRPSDNSNNATDNLSNLATYIARTAKSDLSKKLENDTE